MAVYGSDTFTDTAATALTAHTPESGGPWAAHPSSSAPMVISDANRVRVSLNTGTAMYVLAGASPSSADYDVSATLHYLSNNGSVFAIAGRYHATQDTCYCLRRLVSANQWQLARINAGVVTSLGTAAAASLSAGTDYQIILRMVGSEITALVDGVAVIGPITDASPISATGSAGFRSSVSGGTTGNSFGMHFDDFAVMDSSGPINTVAPEVEGIPIAGESLTTTPGSWIGDPDTFAYQWKADGVALPGETNTTYVVDVDPGVEITCEVIATNEDGDSEPATSVPLTVVAEITDSDIHFMTAAASGLGGPPGVKVVNPAMVWDMVTAQQAEDGLIEYRAVYLRNSHPYRTVTGAKVWVLSQTSSTTTSVSIGIAPEEAGQDVDAIPDESTPPTSVTFSAPVNSGTALDVGTLGPGDARGVWMRWTVNADTAETPNDTYSLAWEASGA